MKPFNLEEAKAGKLVCTRDGRNARIICFDAKREHCPIVALIDDGDKEFVASYCADGRFFYKHLVEHCTDLFMKTEKHEGWVNVYKKDGSKRYVDKQLFNTSVEAMNYGEKWNSYITTTKIEWEE